LNPNTGFPEPLSPCEGGFFFCFNGRGFGLCVH
jgi:hypothetical protein